MWQSSKRKNSSYENEPITHIKSTKFPNPSQTAISKVASQNGGPIPTFIKYKDKEGAEESVMLYNLLHNRILPIVLEENNNNLCSYGHEFVWKHNP